VIEIALFLFVFTLSLLGVEWFRKWSLKKQIFDIPNERSSHVTPRPRGGGLIFVFISLSFYLLFYSFIYLFYGSSYWENFKWSYFIASIAIASISWLDDLYSISTIWRFSVHTLAALWIVLEIGHFQSIYLPYFGQINLGFAGIVLTLFWIIWLTNAYNFMDGIDGIAGLQGVTAGIGWLFVGKILGIDEISIYGGIVAFSCLGFLIHNWDPAKIFMGDVGSAFLGFTFAVIPLLAAVQKPIYSHILPVIAILLLWLFIFDTVFTFFQRLIKKDRVWEPHREHIYQRLVIKGHSHKLVTILYGVNSIIILGYVMTWLYFGNHFLWLVLLPVGIQSFGILIFGYIKKKPLSF
jgi:UDP-N-acetylmuramyl pentapeptide phosphotransferase/UDP-N-acetylglucosamine-1-phosphate transferase